jgi:hypothetical protein
MELELGQRATHIVRQEGEKRRGGISRCTCKKQLMCACADTDSGLEHSSSMNVSNCLRVSSAAST